MCWMVVVEFWCGVGGCVMSDGVSVVGGVDGSVGGCGVVDCFESGEGSGVGGSVFGLVGGLGG